jgi:hypothetical protein
MSVHRSKADLATGPTTSATAPSAAFSRAVSVNVGSFVLCGCPIVAKIAVPTSGAAKMAAFAIRWDLVALSRDQKKLLPHFGEPGTAVFAVEEVEYRGHDRTPSFDHHHAIISLGVRYVIQITAPLDELGIPTARGLGKWSGKSRGYSSASTTLAWSQTLPLWREKQK